MRKLARIAGLIFFVALNISAVGAQQQPDQTQQPQQPQQPEEPQGQEQPIPAYKSPLASEADNGNAANEPIQLAPDTSPLTGIQDLSLGVPLDRHSYWQPHAGLGLTFDTEPPNSGTAGLTGFTTWTTVAGGVDLYRYTGNSELSFQYLGGGIFSTNGSLGAGNLQDANLEAQFTFRRWTLMLIDELRYTPEISFGSSGFIGIPSPLPVPIGLSDSLGVDQTILSEFGQRLTNTSGGQINLLLSPHSSLTFVGAFSELYFIDQALLNSTEFFADAGYNFQLNKYDTIGLSYVFNAFRYANYPQAINTNSALVSYGRRVTGRLAFKISAGPEFAQFQTSISGGVTGPVGVTSDLYLSISADLRYELERTALYASYRHGVAGGSGVLAGAIGDTLLAGVTRQISRTFSGDVNLGYARNSGLSVALPGVSSLNGVYDYWTAGAHLTHPLGRTLHLFVGYDFQYQNSNASFCSGTSCGGSYGRNLATVGISWQARPKAF